ncbi:MAG TPA: dihydrodipicolinate synthase family protein [Pyrinomonadaceae bacterium]|nr:dihydrodipicolinate synthase family protein [Pyrinomonadaceae bacterium]
MKEQNQTDVHHNSSTRALAESLRGILIPFTTPFDEGGEVDLRGLASNLDKWRAAGASGFVALGSTGERVHLTERECLQVIETARSHAPDSFPLIVGAGQQGTRLTIEEVKRWASAGASAVLLITPGYYRAEMTQAALKGFYREVADASRVPVVLYNIPQLTGITLAPETVAELAGHENIIGIKDSSGDMVALGETLRLVPEGFSVLTGHGSALMAALSIGAAGAILAVGCFAPHACVELYRAVHAGDYERARSLQRRLALLVKGVMSRYGIGGIKAAMSELGLEGGWVRPPLSMPADGAREEIAGLLKESGLFGEGRREPQRDEGVGAGAK